MLALVTSQSLRWQEDNNLKIMLSLNIFKYLVCVRLFYVVVLEFNVFAQENSDPSRETNNFNFARGPANSNHCQEAIKPFAGGNLLAFFEIFREVVLDIEALVFEGVHVKDILEAAVSVSL